MSSQDKDGYSGPDQRREHRRKETDRRNEIRFEPTKEDRRKSSGRRKTDGDVWQQHD